MTPAEILEELDRAYEQGGEAAVNNRLDMLMDNNPDLYVAVRAVIDQQDEELREALVQVMAMPDDDGTPVEKQTYSVQVVDGKGKAAFLFMAEAHSVFEALNLSIREAQRRLFESESKGQGPEEEQ